MHHDPPRWLAADSRDDRRGRGAALPDTHGRGCDDPHGPAAHEPQAHVQVERTQARPHSGSSPAGGAAHGPAARRAHSGVRGLVRGPAYWPSVGTYARPGRPPGRVRAAPRGGPVRAQGQVPRVWARAPATLAREASGGRSTGRPGTRTCRCSGARRRSRAARPGRTSPGPTDAPMSPAEPATVDPAHGRVYCCDVRRAGGPGGGRGRAAVRPGQGVPRGGPPAGVQRPVRTRGRAGSHRWAGEAHGRGGGRVRRQDHGTPGRRHQARAKAPACGSHEGCRT